MNNEKAGIQKNFKSYLTIKGGYKGGKSIKASKDIPKVFKLSSNEHPFGASPKAMEAIKQYSKGLHIYPDPTDLRLREALSQFYGNKLSKDQFIAANGGSEIIDLMLKAFVRENDEVIISNPCFVPYSMFAKWLGAKVVDVPLIGESYSLDSQGILNAINERTRVIFLTSPNNPTGTHIPQGVLTDLIAKIPDDILIIYDEVYWHFVSAEDYTTALPFVLQDKPIVAVNSFSKTYGLAGLRIGYCYTTPLIAEYIRQILRPFLIPALSMEAAIAALDDHEFVAQTVALVKEERKFLQEAFTDLSIRFTPSQANFFLIDPTIPGPEFMKHLEANGIMARPTDNFGAPGKIRISVGTREANEALVRVLGLM